MQKHMKNLKKKYRTKLYVLFFLLCSCGGHRIQQSEYIVIDLSEPPLANPIKASDLIESCRYIPLETTNESIIEDIQKLIPVQDGFFILDRHQQLMYFDADGRFIRRIAVKGRGPGEYVNLLDVDLSEQDEILYLHDNSNQILLYSFENEFLRSIRLKKFVTSVMKTSWGYICYRDPLLNFGNDTEALITLDENGNDINVLQYRRVDLKQRSPWVISPIFINMNDEYYYYPQFQDTLYSVKIDKIDPRFVFPKGKYSIAIEEMATLDISRVARARGLVIFDFIINDRQIILKCYRQNNPEVYLYDFASEKLHDISKIVNDIDNSYNFSPWSVYQNQWVEVKNAGDILEESVVQPTALKNLKPEDNPVIRISKLKP